MRNALFLAACLTIFCAPSAFSEDEASAHAARGDGYRREGRLQEAIAEYKEALRLGGVLEPASIPSPRAGDGWAARQHREAIRLGADNPEAR